MTQTVAVLGTGKIGEALLSGMIRAAGPPPTSSSPPAAPSAPRNSATRYGVEPVTNAEAAKRADTLILTVKPQDMGRSSTSSPRTSPPTAWSSAAPPASPPPSSRSASPPAPRSSAS